MTDPDPGPDDLQYPVGVNTWPEQESGAAERARLRMDLLDQHVVLPTPATVVGWP